METKIPLLPKPKNWRRAATLNLFLPGAGLLYLGRRKTGAIVATLFLACMVAALGIFLTGYFRYLSVVLGGNLLQEGQLEQIQDVFHKEWLLVLVILGVALHLISIIALFLARKESFREPGKIEHSTLRPL